MAEHTIFYIIIIALLTIITVILCLACIFAVRISNKISKTVAQFKNKKDWILKIVKVIAELKRIISEKKRKNS